MWSLTSIRRIALGLTAALSFLAAFLIAGEIAIRAVAVPALTPGGDVSPIVTSRDGSVLTAYFNREGKWRLRAAPDEVPTHYLRMLLAYEDKRFFRHGGVDSLAAARAFYQLARTGHVVSGASTLTMQVARLLGGQTAGLLGKLRQAAIAIRLERELSKADILGLYLTLAPFGGNIEGVRMAALQYFGKEPRDITLDEAALLIALPQSPERRRPDLHLESAEAARNRVLWRAVEQGIITSRSAEVASKATVPTGRSGALSVARHLSDRLRSLDPGASVIPSLIDRDLQTHVERIAAEFLADQTDNANIAVLVVDNSDMAVRGYVGGGDYLDADRAGMMDLARARRSPGSALKPVIFGLAFESLIVHPDTIVTDEAIRVNGYAPENFDRKYRGEMTVRDALIASVNTVPVMLLEEVGPTRLINRMRSAGIEVSLPVADGPAGLAVAIGGLGIDLENLAKLYAGIANRGIVRPLRLRATDRSGEGHRLLSPEAAWAVTDILADLPPPPGRALTNSGDGGRRIAYKTGTSYGFRDAWAVGFDTNHTVAVWVGRPDGVGRLGDSAATAAVPVMFKVFDLLEVPQLRVAADVPSNILSQRGDLPNRLQRFPAVLGGAGVIAPPDALSISFPLDGSTISLPRETGRPSPIPLTAKGGREPLQWLIDGRPASAGASGHVLSWVPAGPGELSITVIDADGREATASVWVD